MVAFLYGNYGTTTSVVASSLGMNKRDIFPVYESFESVEPQATDMSMVWVPADTGTRLSELKFPRRGAGGVAGAWPQKINSGTQNTDLPDGPEILL